MGLESYT